MLTTLRIRNLALVVDLTVELEGGLNIITGETGAGKSILIGALNLVLGARADRGLIRAGCDACSVEAVFDITSLHAPLDRFLEENGIDPCEHRQLVLKRSFTAAGANRQFVNGSPTTLSILGNIGSWLVDIHGPHDHQSLLHASEQLLILDAFGGAEPQRQQFADLLDRRDELLRQKAGLIVDDQTFARKLELLRFQVQEITAAQLEPDEEAAVHQHHQLVSNSARRLELSQAALSQLDGDEQALLVQAGKIGRSLQDLERIDPAAASLCELHDQITQGLRELQDALSHYADRIDLDTSALQTLEERLTLLQSLKRKYGSTLEEVISFGDSARRELDGLDRRDEQIESIRQSLIQADKELLCLGKALSQQRRDLIPRLSKAVARQLSDLGFQRSHFEILLTSTLDAPNVAEDDKDRATPPATRCGFDQIEFLFAPNPGEPPRPLRAIASSGEIARVMLALKTVLAAQDRIPVLVFDEVDANVGGETAAVVGDKMRQIARTRQVLCITHLAPVAACADAHLVAEKEVEQGRTVASIRLLKGAERVTELARMLGGQSTAARKHAEALLK